VLQEVFKRAGWLGHDSEYNDEDSATGDEERAKYHPWRKGIAEEGRSKECIPKEGNGTEWGQNSDW
jgi:hypothetical protein